VEASKAVEASKEAVVEAAAEATIMVEEAAVMEEEEEALVPLETLVLLASTVVPMTIAARSALVPLIPMPKELLSRAKDTVMFVVIPTTLSLPVPNVLEAPE
jgi:hypothetical protein